MHWRTILGWAIRLWPWAASAVAVLLAIYYGPKQVLETYDWYVDRFRDRAVLDLLEHAITIPHVDMFQQKIQVRTIPFAPSTIAKRLGRSEASVLRSLRRLERHRKAMPSMGGWLAEK